METDRTRDQQAPLAFLKNDFHCPGPRGLAGRGGISKYKAAQSHTRDQQAPLANLRFHCRAYSVHICVCMCVYIYIYIYTNISLFWPPGVAGRAGVEHGHFRTEYLRI